MQNLSDHVRALSRELLDDIELRRLDAEKLLLKCSRLARLAGSEEVQQWIQLEMTGYNDTDAVSVRYLYRTGRWINVEKKTAYWGPLAQQQAGIEALKSKIATLRLPDIGGEWANVAVQGVIREISATTKSISAMSGVRSRVMSMLHSFVSETYYAREFAAVAEGTFERYKRDVDILLAEKAAAVLQKIPAIVDRLSEGSDEAVSQALTTVRRVLETFADAVFPPSEAVIELGGNVLKLDAYKHQNRINAYVAQRTESVPRRQRLRQNLANLFDRVSTGVHKDVTAEEAYSLFLNVYLLLGEVLHLQPGEQAVDVQDQTLSANHAVIAGEEG